MLRCAQNSWWSDALKHALEVFHICYHMIQECEAREEWRSLKDYPPVNRDLIILKMPCDNDGELWKEPIVCVAQAKNVMELMGIKEFKPGYKDATWKVLDPDLLVMS